MRIFVLAAVAALLPVMSVAGNLENPWERPTVTPPAQPSLSWDGLYAGVGVTTTESARYGSSTTYKRACTTERPNSHNGQKCQLSKHDFDHLRDTGQFDVVKNPWSKKLDGPAIYHTGSYYGLWMNGQSSVSFTSDVDGSAPTSANKPTSNTITDTITDIFTIGEDEEVTGNLFAGYRHVTNGGVGLGLEVGTVGGAEAQIGASQGRWFTYAGFNSDEEVTAGVDVLMGQRGNWFLGGKVANGPNSTRGEARIGIKF